MNFSFRGRHGVGAQDAAPTQGDKVHLATLWSLANRALPPPAWGHRPTKRSCVQVEPHRWAWDNQATVTTTNQDGMTAGMPTRGVTQEMSQHGAGPMLGVHFQAWDGSAPQYQGLHKCNLLGET
jgi:hypothetical protein